MTLEAMFDALERDGGIYRPSEFWRALNDKNVRQLETEGLSNIKRTLAQNYFTWVINPRHKQFRSMAARQSLADWREVFADFPRYDPACGLTRWKFFNLAIFTRMLYRVASRHDPLRLLEKVSEPAYGNPFPIHYKGRLISQDTINSVLELYTMFEGREIDFDAPLRICEIGAGYGRNAWLFLTLFPNCAYTIVDIPPALYVGQEYLKATTGRQVRHLLPQDAERLPDDSFDLLLNISSFHEMTAEQVTAYFRMVDRLVSGRFYIKQWIRWENPKDNVCLTEADYPYSAGWKKIFSRTTVAQPDFFEAAYAID